MSAKIALLEIDKELDRIAPLRKIIIINGTESDYLITSDGNVISLKRKKIRILSKRKDHLVSLYKDGIYHTYLTHRLVAEYFCADGKTSELSVVEFINGDHSNEDYRNLRWVRQSIADGRRDGYTSHDESMVHAVCQSLSAGESVATVAKKFDVKVPWVYKIIAGNVWADITCEYDLSFYHDFDKAYKKFIANLPDGTLIRKIIIDGQTTDFEITSNGRVISLVGKQPRFLNTRIDNRKPCILINSKGKSYWFMLCQLVMAYFIIGAGTEIDARKIRYRDGDMTNVDYRNLYLCD